MIIDTWIRNLWLLLWLLWLTWKWGYWTLTHFRVYHFIRTCKWEGSDDPPEAATFPKSHCDLKHHQQGWQEDLTGSLFRHSARIPPELLSKWRRALSNFKTEPFSKFHANHGLLLLERNVSITEQGQKQTSYSCRLWPVPSSKFFWPT